MIDIENDILSSEIELVSEKLLQIGVVPLKWIILHPIKSKLIYQQSVGVSFTAMVLTLFYWTTKYIFLCHIDLAVVCEIISSFGLYTLSLLKCIPLIYYNHLIRRLLENKRKFWAADNAILKGQVLEIYSTALFYTKIFVILVIITLSMFMWRPFYDKGALLTLQWYDERYYIQALAYQTVFAFVLVSLVIGFNGLFIITITHMRAQYCILNYTVKYYKNDGSKNDIKMLVKCVNHHRFLLEYVKDIEKVFMIQLLALYALTIASCCMELYAITEAPTTLISKVRSFIYVTSLLVQLAMFCFPAAELTNEIFLLSESLYLSNWEEGSRQLQTWLPFAILATQQVVDFKALGLITINKMAFVDVAKSTVSFLTLMRNMKMEKP